MINAFCTTSFAPQSVFMCTLNALNPNCAHDIWGRGYQIVVKRVGFAKPANLSLQRMKDVTNELFPVSDLTPLPQLLEKHIEPASEDGG